MSLWIISMFPKVESVFDQVHQHDGQKNIETTGVGCRGIMMARSDIARVDVVRKVLVAPSHEVTNTVRSTCSRACRQGHQQVENAHPV